MKKIQHLSFLLALLILITSCASTTVIKSEPSGAKLYLNGEPVGTTPYKHRDTKIVGSTTSVSLVMDDYETLDTSFSRDEEVDAGAIVGGIFLLVPFLWVMKYKPTHTYELIPTSDVDSVEKKKVVKQKTSNQSKAERLRELKTLLDEDIITSEEFEIEKKKILEED